MIDAAAIISSAALLTLAANSVYASWRASRDAEAIANAIRLIDRNNTYDFAERRRAANALERIAGIAESAKAEHEHAKADAKRPRRHQ